MTLTTKTRASTNHRHAKQTTEQNKRTQNNHAGTNVRTQYNQAEIIAQGQQKRLQYEWITRDGQRLSQRTTS